MRLGFKRASAAASAMAAAKRTAKRASPRKATKRATPKRPATKKAASKRAAPKRAVRKTPKRSATGSRIRGLKKAEGEAPVRAYLAKLPPEHRAIGEAVDALVAKHVPEARRAIKWSSPLWGLEGRGWFMSFGSFKSYAKVSFFNGVALDPVPPEGESKLMRSINIPSLAELDRKQMAAWIAQAAANPGWGK